ncbi:MAG: hypothetical protein IBX55_16645 [Methyloprofundus sp.]|nr:hypothetical protein [Methyloprofundus sp.]
MARSKREKLTGRKNAGAFIALPKDVINSPKFGALSGNSVKLLIQIFEQYNGKNNGDLGASFNVLKNKGWKSKTTLAIAIKQLMELGFIVKTRQGHYPKTANLFAVTWIIVDFDIYGKYDAGAKTYIGKNIGSWR